MLNTRLHAAAQDTWSTADSTATGDLGKCPSCKPLKKGPRSFRLVSMDVYIPPKYPLYHLSGIKGSWVTPVELLDVDYGHGEAKFCQSPSVRGSVHFFLSWFVVVEIQLHIVLLI